MQGAEGAMPSLLLSRREKKQRGKEDLPAHMTGRRNPEELGRDETLDHHYQEKIGVGNWKKPANNNFSKKELNIKKGLHWPNWKGKRRPVNGCGLSEVCSAVK